MTGSNVLMAVLTAVAVVITLRAGSDHTNIHADYGAPDLDQPPGRARGPPTPMGETIPADGNASPSCPIEHRNTTITRS
jgi:hypothetical protein